MLLRRCVRKLNTNIFQVFCHENLPENLKLQMLLMLQEKVCVFIIGVKTALCFIHYCKLICLVPFIIINFIDLHSYIKELLSVAL